MPLDPRTIQFFPASRDSQELVLDITSFQGGVNTKAHPTTLELNEAVRLDNVLLGEGFLAEQRQGSTNVLAGISEPGNQVLGVGRFDPALDPNGKRLLMATNAGYFQWDGTGNWDQLTGGTPIGTGPVIFVQGRETSPSSRDVLYILQDGSDKVWEYDGSTTLTQASGGQNGLDNSIPLGQDAIFWLERLWVAKDGIVYFSAVGEPTKVDTNLGYKVDTSDKMVRIVNWMNNGIICFFRSQIWLLDVDQANFGDPFFDQTQITQLNSEYGAVSGRSVAQAGSDWFFLSRFGVHRLSRTQRDRALGAAIPISDKIQGTIDRINWSFAHRAAGWTWNDLYILSVPLDSSATNNHCIVYDIREDAWTEFPIGASDWVDTRLGDGAEQLYFGNPSTSGAGEVFRFFDSAATKDENTDIAFRVDTPAYTFGTQNRSKLFRYLELFADAEGGGQIEVYVSVDGQDYTLLNGSPFVVAQDGPIVGQAIVGQAQLSGGRSVSKKFYLDYLGPAESMSFSFRESTAESCQIIRFTVSAYADESRLD